MLFGVGSAGRSGRLLTLWLGVLASGCGTARYVEKHPETQRVGPARVRPSAIALTSAARAEVSLETELPDGARLHGVYAEQGEDVARFSFAVPGLCAREALGLFFVDGEPHDRTRAAPIGGTRDLELVWPPSAHYVVLDVESDGSRRCVPVDLDWPSGWERVEPWEFLLNVGGDFELTNHRNAYGVGGIRLDVFRWFDDFRLGGEVGLFNVGFCQGGTCSEDESPQVLLLGAEADWFFFRGKSPLGLAGSGIGFRSIVYMPKTADDPRTPLMISPQLALRLFASFARDGGPSLSPAGLTLDHGMNFGPVIVVDGGSVGWLFGYSIGAGWSL